MKAQQWSMEAILAISVFIVVFVFLITFIALRPLDQTKQLELQSVRIYEEARSQRGFIEGSSLDKQKLDDWFLLTNSTQNLTRLKNELGLTTDFCIYFEDGNMTVTHYLNGTTVSYYGVGDSSILIGQTPCGRPINYG